MLRNVFLKSLRDQFKAILGWGLGLAALMYVALLFFPQLSGMREIDEIFRQMPALSGFLGDITSLATLEGYVTSRLLSYLPVVLAIYVILAAASTITGEIESGTMDFLLAHPVPRWRVLLEKYAALLVALTAICVITGVGMWLGGVTIGEKVSFGTWMLAAFNLIPITLLFGTVAFALACAVRGRGLPVGVASGLAVGGYIMNGLVPLVEGLKPYRELTIYHLFLASKPFSTGIHAGYITILLAASLALLVFSLVSFQRRDILA